MLGEERTTQYTERRFNVAGNAAAQFNIYESRKDSTTYTSFFETRKRMQMNLHFGFPSTIHNAIRSQCVNRRVCFPRFVL